MSVDGFMKAWEGTSYMAGASSLGQGVDCMRLLVAWFNFKRSLTFILASEAQDGALHDPAVIVRVRRSLLKAYQPSARFKFGATVPQAGDGLAVGRLGDPYHVGVVADDGVGVWHATRPRVCRTSLQALTVDGYKIRELFRCL